MKKVEGYWADTKNGRSDQYPIPVKDGFFSTYSTTQRDLFIAVLAGVEAEHPACIKRHYKGTTYSRFTGEGLGNGEFTLKTWSWPQDFRTHYLEKYNVQVSSEFVDFILQEYHSRWPHHDLPDVFKRFNKP